MLNPDPWDTKLDYMMDIGVLLYYHQSAQILEAGLGKYIIINNINI